MGGARVEGVRARRCVREETCEREMARRLEECTFWALTSCTCGMSSDEGGAVAKDAAEADTTKPSLRLDD